MNQIAGVIASVLLAPIAWLPGWLSATLIAAVTGVIMLLMFKYTSNQKAIKHTRSQIKADLLALSLFKDDLRVGLRVQMALLLGADRLLALSLVPMLVMLVPMCLVLGQLALWFQARPLSIGEETVVTVRLAEDADQELQQIQFDPGPAATVTVGPVRVPSKKMVCWNIQTAQAGLHQLTFRVAGQQFTKELAVGGDYMTVSLERPASSLSDVLLHPREKPFATASPVQSIEVNYPPRSSWTTGTDWWMVYWFVASMVAAFLAKPFLNVNL
jgi:uncharacterized membrane protein (DUF106 family)